MGVVFLAVIVLKVNNQWLRRLLIIVPLAGSFSFVSAIVYEYIAVDEKRPRRLAIVARLGGYAALCA